MNIDKAKILLDKINVLMRSMSVAPEQIAEIEKDLMKNYIKGLYEIFLVDEAPAAPVSAPAPKPAPAPAPVVIKQEPRVVIPPQPAPVVVPPAPAPKPIAATPQPPTPKPAPPAPEIVASEVVEETPPPPAPKPTPTPTPKKVSTSFQIDEDLEEIFNIAEATDLSERLSQSPIKNLTKAFSINEKLFTIKELFNGDADTFNATLSDLNKMKSFEEATNFLAVNIAGKFGWSKKSKKKKAKEFVKTVKRRYN